LTLAGKGHLIQKLPAVRQGVLLDSLTGFLQWTEEREARWRVELKFWSRQNRPREGNDPAFLAKFHRCRVQLTRWVRGATKPHVVEVQLRLDEKENLVSTPGWLDIQNPEASSKVKLIVLGRDSAALRSSEEMTR